MKSQFYDARLNFAILEFYKCDAEEPVPRYCWAAGIHEPYPILICYP